MVIAMGSECADDYNDYTPQDAADKMDVSWFDLWTKDVMRHCLLFHLAFMRLPSNDDSAHAHRELGCEPRGLKGSLCGNDL